MFKQLKRSLFLIYILLSQNTFAGVVASFTHSSLNICQGSYVNFRNESTGSISSYSWDFGGGAPNSTFSYPNPAGGSLSNSVQFNSTVGSPFTVTLTVSDGTTPSTISVQVYVTGPVITPPTFNYPAAPLCMYSTGYGTAINPSAGLPPGGTFSPLIEPAIAAFFNNATGVITTDKSIPAGTYPIFYTYPNGTCDISTQPTDVVLNNVNPDNISSADVAGVCDVLKLTAGSNSIGAIQWQFSTASGIWMDYTGAINLSYQTPTLFVTTQFQAIYSGPGCPTEPSLNTLIYTVAGVSTPGTASASTNQLCLNTTSPITLSGFFGTVTWLKSTDLGVTWSNASGFNSYVPFTFGNSTVTTFNPSSETVQETIKYQASVTYAQTGTNCNTVLSNIITVTYNTCSVTAIINNTTTSDVCVGSTSGVTLAFGDLSNASSSPNPGISSITGWDWSFPGSSGSPTLHTTNSTNPIVVFDQPGVHSVSLTVSGPGGINNIVSTNVTIDGLSSFTINNGSVVTVCPGAMTLLSGTTPNTGQTYQWQSSPDNSTFTNILAATGNTYNVPGNSPGFYRVLATDGMCPQVASGSQQIDIAPSPTIAQVSPRVQSICYGNSINLSVTGTNGSFQWQTTNDTTASWTDLGGQTNNVFNTGNLLLASSFYYRAKIIDVLGGICNTQPTKAFVVNVTVCPIAVTFVGSNSGRACNSNPIITFNDATPTINGVTFTQWQWDFGPGATPATLITNTGAGGIAVQYDSPGPRLVTLTISGTAGTYNYSNQNSVPYTITIDGIPSIVGFGGSAAICAGSKPFISFTSYFPTSPSPAILQWYSRTLPGGNFTPFANAGIYWNPVLNTSMEYIVTASNGVCTPFTTTSAVVTVTSQPVISLFTYAGEAFCNNSGAPILPILTTNGFNSYATYSSTLLPGLDITSSGQVSPSTSIPNNYTVRVDIPSIGNCLATSAGTNITIGKYPTINSLSYGSIPYCNNEGAIPALYFPQPLPTGSFTTTALGFPLSAASGNITLDTSVHEGLYVINYVTTAQNGCPTNTFSTIVTISGLPATPDFSYPNFGYFCNSDTSILPIINSGIAFGDGGHWTITGTNISINGIGKVLVSSLTGSGNYDVKYIKPHHGGCIYDISNQFQVRIETLHKAPIFNYGASPTYCASDHVGNPIPTVNSQNLSNGSFFSKAPDIIVDFVNGSVTPKAYDVGGPRTIYYEIPPGQVCPAVIDSTTIFFNGTPSPDFNFPDTYFCNVPSTIISPSSITGTTTGGFFQLIPISGGASSVGVSIDPNIGSVGLTTSTGSGLYNVRYIASISGCFLTTISSPLKSIYLQKNPPVPYFSYGTVPFCNNSVIPIKDTLNLLHPTFSAPSVIGINVNDGTIYPPNFKNDIYTITVTNTSILQLGNLFITKCPNTYYTTVITIGSGLAPPPLDYGRTLLFCDNEGTSNLKTTVTGGTFAVNPPYLDFNTTTGSFNVSGINTTVSDPFSKFEISYTIPQPPGCPLAISTADLTIYKSKTRPVFSYPKSDYCQDETPPVPQGNFKYGYFAQNISGLVIDSTLGIINFALSIPNTYQVEYIVPPGNAVCPVLTTTFGVTIHKTVDKPILSYGDQPFCRTLLKAKPLVLGFAANGSFSSTGLTVTSDSGIVDLTSLSDGIYKIIYTNPAKNGCSAVSSDPANLTVTSPVKTPVFNYADVPECDIGIIKPVGYYGNGVFKASKSIVFTDSLNGTIDLEKSVAGGPYVITYFIPPLSNCQAIIGTATLTIIKAKIGFIELTQNVGELCGGSIVQIRLSDYAGNLLWQEKRTSLGIWGNAGGTFDSTTKIFTTSPLIDSVAYRAVASIPQCPTQEFSNEISLRVVEKSRGGSAVADTTILCDKPSTKIHVNTFKGKIQWQYSNDSLNGWSDLVNKTVNDSVLTTPPEITYGTQLFYRAKVTNGFCAPDYSNSIRIRVCESGSFIPNILTPETGTENSTWSLYQLNLRPQAEIFIYNIYGVVVAKFFGSDFNQSPSQGWNGGGLPTGAYWYLIDRKDGSNKDLTGSITILK